MKEINLNAQKWIAALRSGEFKQTKDGLKELAGDDSVVGHCCLGVACEVYLREGNKLPTDIVIRDGK